MLLSTVKNIIESDYLLECGKKGVSPVDYTDSQLALWISQGQQDLVDRLNLLITYSDLSYTAGTTYTTVSLPANFGKITKAEINGQEIKIVGVSDIPSNGTMETGIPSSCAVYHNGTAWLLALSPVPAASGTVRVWYVVNTLFHDGDTATAQSWGTYSKSTVAGFSGSLILPERYVPLLVLYILGKFFDDKMQEYEVRVSRARSNSAQTANFDITYNFGGIE